MMRSCTVCEIPTPSLPLGGGLPGQGPICPGVCEDGMTEARGRGALREEM